MGGDRPRIFVLVKGRGRGDDYWVFEGSDEAEHGIEVIEKSAYDRYRIALGRIANEGATFGSPRDQRAIAQAALEEAWPGGSKAP